MTASVYKLKVSEQSTVILEPVFELKSFAFESDCFFALQSAVAANEMFVVCIDGREYLVRNGESVWPWHEKQQWLPPTINQTH